MTTSKKSTAASTLVFIVMKKYSFFWTTEAEVYDFSKKNAYTWRVGTENPKESPWLWENVI